MGKKIRISLNKSVRDETGQVFIWVLIMLVLGSLVMAPLLAFMSTGLKTGQAYEEKTDKLYAADAGIDDAIWQIKYENVSTLSDPVVYDEYDYASVWPYDLAEEVNDESVSVTIKNEWIPIGIDPTSPGFAALASGIIDAGKLRINGSLSGTLEYRIRIDYAADEADEDLVVQSIGIWLPTGFSYVSGSSNLEDDVLAVYYEVPTITPYAGGEAVIWSFGSVLFKDFPLTGTTESAVITFDYTSETGRRLETVSWIDTTGVPDIPFSWDDDTKVYAITSGASDTIIESNIYMSGRYSSLLDNAITSTGDITIQPGTIVNGDVHYNGVLDNSGTINGEEITDEIDWPDIEDWRQFFLDDVTGAPDPGLVVDVKDYDYDNPLGPWYREGSLEITNTAGVVTVPLGGTIYVIGDMELKQPGVPKAFTIDLDYNTIFCEGNISFPADRVGVKGSGCIIAIGDIDFQPVMESQPGDFVFVCSLTGTVNFHPQGDFYGSLAGNVLVNLQPNSSITWTPPPGQLNLPGMGGGSTGGFGSSVTKYTWKIN